MLEAGRCVEHAATHELLIRPRTAIARDLLAGADCGAAPTRGET
ncbi:hypothetical protein [Saccharopolyspora shandongensis]|nr:hypothetical protein [Saccharopolyspora shandongensis]